MKQRHPDVYRYRGWRAYSHLAGYTVLAIAAVVYRLFHPTEHQVSLSVVAVWTGIMAAIEWNKIRSASVRIDGEGLTVTFPLREPQTIAYRHISKVSLDDVKGICTIKFNGGEKLELDRRFEDFDLLVQRIRTSVAAAPLAHIPESDVII